MNIRIHKSCFVLLIFICLLGCTTVQTNNKISTVETMEEPIKEYFVTEMTLYNEMQQRHLRIVEINEKESFIEMVRQILDNPDYIYSYAQNDLYYVAQMYNAFSMAEYEGRSGDKFKAVNSSGTQTTFKNVVTGQIMDIRTQLNQFRLSEVIKYWQDNGYSIAVETFDRSQTILARNYSQTSQSTKSDNYFVYVISDSKFKIILSDNVSSILDGLEKEFNLMYMPDEIFNNVNWYIGNIQQSDFDQFFQSGYNFIGIYDSSNNGFNVAIVRIDRVPNVEWKGFYYTNINRNWVQLDNDWVYRNMFNWIKLSKSQPTSVQPSVVQSAPDQSTSTQTPTPTPPPTQSNRPIQKLHYDFFGGYIYGGSLPFGTTTLPLGVMMGSNDFYFSVSIGGSDDGFVAEWTVGLALSLNKFLLLPIGLGANHSGPDDNRNHRFVMEIGLMPVLDIFYLSATYRLIGFSKSGFTIGAGLIF